MWEYIMLLSFSFIAIFLLFIGLFFMKLGLKLFVAPRDHRDLAKAHSPKNMKDIVNGKADAYKNGERDYAVIAGMSVNLKTKKLEPQGRVSRELINPLI